MNERTGFAHTCGRWYAPSFLSFCMQDYSPNDFIRQLLLVLLGIFIAMLYPAGVVRLFSKYIKEIKQ